MTEQELKVAGDNYARNCRAIEQMARAILILAARIPEAQQREVKELIEPLSKGDFSQAAGSSSSEQLNQGEKTIAALRVEAAVLLTSVCEILSDET